MQLHDLAAGRRQQTGVGRHLNRVDHVDHSRHAAGGLTTQLLFVKRPYPTAQRDHAPLRVDRPIGAARASFDRPEMPSRGVPDHDRFLHEIVLLPRTWLLFPAKKCRLVERDWADGWRIRWGQQQRCMIRLLVCNDGWLVFALPQSRDAGERVGDRQMRSPAHCWGTVVIGNPPFVFEHGQYRANQNLRYASGLPVSTLVTCTEGLPRLRGLAKRCVPGPPADLLPGRPAGTLRPPINSNTSVWSIDIAWVCSRQRSPSRARGSR